MYEEELDVDFPTKEELGSLRNKRERLRKNYFRLKRLADNSAGYDVCSYRNADGEWCEREDAIRMKRYYKSRDWKYLKHQCNRKFRRTKLVTSSRGAQHKMTELWWAYY
jgi:NAD+--asparagine ADP-ribosyltransferase